MSSATSESRLENEGTLLSPRRLGVYKRAYHNCILYHIFVEKYSKGLIYDKHAHNQTFLSNLATGQLRFKPRAVLHILLHCYFDICVYDFGADY